MSLNMLWNIVCHSGYKWSASIFPIIIFLNFSFAVTHLFIILIISYFCVLLVSQTWTMAVFNFNILHSKFRQFCFYIFKLVKSGMMDIYCILYYTILDPISSGRFPKPTNHQLWILFVDVIFCHVFTFIMLNICNIILHFTDFYTVWMHALVSDDDTELICSNIIMGLYTGNGSSVLMGVVKWSV